jgi:hypothetical protein
LQSLYVIDVTRGYLPAALLLAAAYMEEESEALLVQGAADYETVRKAVDRFHPATVYAMNGCAPRIALGKGGEDELPVQLLPGDGPSLLAWLIERGVDSARGAVLFPAHSPSWAIKAAALATRLGYLAWPLEEAAGFAYAAPPGIPILVAGEAPGSLTDKLQGREYRHLPGDRAIAQYLKEASQPVDYVVLVNSADLEPPAFAAGPMGTTWVQGLSLLAPLLASYRQALVIDARTPRPDSREIERTLNQKTQDTGLAPEYLAILAAPGAIPFIYEPQHTFTGAEEPTRDIHLKHNSDIFFDCAEGRLFGLTAGKVSLQILSTKHYASLPGLNRQKALFFSRPHVEGGVTFAIDEAVGRTQVRPLLEKAGFAVTELYDTETTPQSIAKHLPGSGLMVYAGHGSQESLSTHQTPLYAEFLPPEIAPGVVYACACSTMHPRPAHMTSDGGFSFSEEATPLTEQIGPAFVDRGALAFVGGLTAEDILLNTPMYVAFVQALALKGLSVGHAIRAARNHALTYLGVLSQTAPDAYAGYRADLAHAIQQQVLLGDPAFTPYRQTEAARLPVTVESGEAELRLTLSVPEDRWTRVQVKVDEGKPNKEFHRARTLEAWLPVGEDVFNWGENYTVAKDVDDLSDKGVVGSYIRLSADLPAGRVPTGLTLEAAEAADAECLLCGQHHPVDGAVARFSKYVVPFAGDEAPVTVDQTRGWAFAVEELPHGLRVHWLAPALAIEDGARRAIRLQQATFVLKHAPGIRVEGRLELAPSAPVQGAPGAMEGTRGHLPEDLLLSFGPVAPPDPNQKPDQKPAKKPRLNVIAQTLSGPGGRWAAWLPAGAMLGLKADLALPVYRHVQEAAFSFAPDTVTGLTIDGSPLTAALKVPETGVLRGTVVDGHTGRPLSGARVRLWRGKNGAKSPVYEGYVGEEKADAQGRFEFAVPTGSYLVAAAHRSDRRYLAGKGNATVYKQRESAVLVAMEPGAVVTGRLEFDGPYVPKHVGVKLLEHGAKEETVLAAGRTLRDGRFEILVPTGKPFDIKIQPEGFAPLLDENGGEGYHLSPGETLERSFKLEGVKA